MLCIRVSWQKCVRIPVTSAFLLPLAGILESPEWVIAEIDAFLHRRKED